MQQQQTPSFSLSTTSLHFNDQADTLKLCLKNTSLRTNQYQLMLSDQQHFKLQATAYRKFSLAPGISKQLTLKHNPCNQCNIPQRHILIIKVRDSQNNTQSIQCRCPMYTREKEDDIIQFDNVVDLGEFDQKVGFEVQVRNISGKNLKIVFEDRLEFKNNSSQTNILITSSAKKLIIKTLTTDSILLVGQSLKFPFELAMAEHGSLDQRIDFHIISEQTTTIASSSKSSSKNKYAHHSRNNSQSNNLLFDQLPRRYSIKLKGISVSKKLLLKNQQKQSITQLYNQLLTGTTKFSYFYIGTQYHEDLPYTLQAYFETDKPQGYAQKWDNLRIQFQDHGNANANSDYGMQKKQHENRDKHQIIDEQENQQLGGNKCEGVLKKNTLNRIDYRIVTKYTTDDQNYVSKYSKILFQDDSNALRMRNSEYSKKYEDIQIKILIKLSEENKKKLLTSKSIKPQQKSFTYFQTIIPFKCTLVNPSIRCQIHEHDQTTNITLFNQTKLSIPFKFPMHSLFRIGYNQREQLTQGLSAILPANKKQHFVVKWMKSNQRCSLFMEIPCFDVVLYQTREKQLKNKNIIALPASRRRPMTSISACIKAIQNQPKQKTNQYALNTIFRQNSQPSFAKSCRPTSILPLQPIQPTPTISTNNLTHNRQLSATKRPMTPSSSSDNFHNKKATLIKQLPKLLLASKRNKQIIPEIDDLRYLVQEQKIVRNTHGKQMFVLQILEHGFVVLMPGQFFTFDNNPELFNASKSSLNWGFDVNLTIRYKIYGHSPTYSIELNQPHHNQCLIKSSQQQHQQSHIRTPNRPTHHNPNLYEPPAYQIFSRQIKMSFKQSKQQFQIIEPILIKNCSSTKPLQINCVTIDNQFFKCKQNNGILVIPPEQVGKFRIGFQPQNTIKLSVINRQPPKQLRRKAIVKSDHSINIDENLRMVTKELKLLINKNMESIACVGEVIQKSCSIKPYKINLVNCKYGSPQVVQTMIVTNTSPHIINFIIESPPQLTVKPKTGTINPKSTQNCTVTFKPCKKISNFSTNIKIFIGGSHLQLIPVFINVQDPQIYIKQTQLTLFQNAICGNQIQQLNLQMTLINNNPSQSFIQINLKSTPLYLGYTKNYQSASSGVVLQNFIRCSQIIQQPKQQQQQQCLLDINNNNNNSNNKIDDLSRCLQNSIHSICSQSNISQLQLLSTNKIIMQKLPQICSITVAANSFIIIPLILRIFKTKIGQNVIQINKNIASLVGFGQIKSPKIIKYNCSKTLLKIAPYKQFHQIVLTQSQKNYQISLKNLVDKTIKVKTVIKNKQLNKQVNACIDKSSNNRTNQKQKQKEKEKQRGSNHSNKKTIKMIEQQGTNINKNTMVNNNEDNQNNNDKPIIKQPSIICTFKDIEQYIKPQGSLDLNMSFICFESQKQAITSTYELAIYVKQLNDEEDLDDSLHSINSLNNSGDNLKPYFSAVINVVVPQPFLEVSPNVLVMPTVGVNNWSRESFIIRNNGYKQIFVKIKKPTNIAFDLQCQIINPDPQPLHHTRQLQKPSTNQPSSLTNRPSNISISSQKSKQTSSQSQQTQPPQLLQNQLTKIKNTIQVRVNFKSKSKVSFKCIIQIQDNLGNTYPLVVVGTCTDSPFFINQVNGAGVSSLLSANSFNSNQSFNSQKSFTSTNSHRNINTGHNRHGSLRKNNLQPTDIQDILFLNNWIGSLIPQISNQSTFFYVWLTKIENFVKFLKQFNVSLINSKIFEHIYGHHTNNNGNRKMQRLSNDKQKQKKKNANNNKISLAIIFQDLKQQGFQLNSLRIQLLQKADQLQWLNFMWFFLSKTIVSSNFLSWLSKNICNSKEQQQITYGYVQKNFQQLITIIMTNILELKKQQNNNKSIDWRYLFQNFESLLQNFKHVESRRHLILSLNILQHKLCRVQPIVMEISDFQFVLKICNRHSRRVRYFLQCNPKVLSCQQSSNKVLPTETTNGYAFIVQQNQQISLTFSLKNYTISSLAVITKSVIDLMDIFMWNNVIWNPITIYKLKLKRKDDIIHNVCIECENKASQEWVYKYQAKISAEYRVFFEVQDGSSAMKLVSGQLGYMKKGQTTVIRVVYSPEQMNKCEASLKIVNTMIKEVFKVTGRPLHSSKIQYEKNIKIVQNCQHQQIISLPWQTLSIAPKPIPLVNLQSPKNLTSNSSRDPTPGTTAPTKIISIPPTISIKLINPSNPLSQSPSSKYPQCLLTKSHTINPLRKQISITLKYRFDLLIRSLELFYQVFCPQTNQSRIFRLVIDVIPEPIFINAQIQCEYNAQIVQAIRVHNIAQINENFNIQYGYVQAEADVRKIIGGSSWNNGGMLNNIHKGLFQIIKHKNNESIPFTTKQHQNPLPHIDLNLKYSPNQKNCFYSQQQQSNLSNLSNISQGKAGSAAQTSRLQKSSVPLKKKTALSGNLNGLSSNSNSIMIQTTAQPIPITNTNVSTTNNKNDGNNSAFNHQLPNFYLLINYQASLYQVLYLFKPKIKVTSIKQKSALTSSQQKDIIHNCQPLIKYSVNSITIQNNSDTQVTYQVQTDLYEISGKNQITLQPLTTGKYVYEVYGLHLGVREGKIRFIQCQVGSGGIRHVCLEFNVKVCITENAALPLTSVNNGFINGCIPKGSYLEGLRLYNQYFQITSTIRKPKVFSIFLQNMSQKQIEYEVCCSSQYLHPRITTINGNKKYIKINKQSQFQLEIEYLPYFVGRKQTKLCLYNPHQPEITYRVEMVGQEIVESVAKEMSKIGEIKPIQIVIQNPFPSSLSYNLTVKSENNKTKLSPLSSKQPSSLANPTTQPLPSVNPTPELYQLQLQLKQLILNSQPIKPQDYATHIRLFDQSSIQSVLVNNGGQSHTPTKTKITFSQPHTPTPIPTPTPIIKHSPLTPTNLKQSHHGNNNTKKMLVLFMSNNFQKQYEYLLTFNSKFGDYKYKISYRYPQVQRMAEQVLFYEGSQYGSNGKVKEISSKDMIKMLAHNKVENKNNVKQSSLKVSIPYFNRFNEDLQLIIKTNIPQLFLKLSTPPLSTPSQSTLLPIQTQTPALNPLPNSSSNFYNTKYCSYIKLSIPAYTKQTICLDLLLSKLEQIRSQFEIEVRSIKYEEYTWVYPVTLYQVYQNDNRAPVMIAGEARVPIGLKLYPFVAYNCGKVQIFTEKICKLSEKQQQNNNNKDDTKIQLKIKQDQIRKRLPAQNNKQSKPTILTANYSQLSNNNNNNDANTQSFKADNNFNSNSNSNGNSNGMAMLQNVISVDRAISQHQYLNADYLYEIELEVNVASASKSQGYFYVYQTSQHVESRHISPATSQKHLLKQDQPIQCKKMTNCCYFVQKIPFILKIDSPKIQTLEFQANVGQKATIKIKLDKLINKQQSKSISPLQSQNNAQIAFLPKIFDFITGSNPQPKTQVRIELHNNKCRQFSAFYNQKQQCIEVSYWAQEYSGLKRGKIQIYVAGMYSQYELVGKFPTKEVGNKRNSKIVSVQ